MRKNFVLPLVLVACLCTLSLAGCASKPQAPETSAGKAPEPAAAQVKEFTLGLGNAVGSDPYVQMCKFADKVAELSKGTMKVNIYAGGVLFSEKDALDAIMNNTVDFSFLNSTSVSSVIKDLAILAVPGTYRYKSADDVTSLIDFEAAIHDTLSSIYADYKVKYLTLRPPAEAAIVCTRKQVKSPDDVKGMVFRTSGTWLGKLMNKWGLATSTLPIGEVTTALQRNTVQGTLTGSEQVKTWKFYEVAPYITLMPETDQVGCVVMSMPSWNALNKEQQAWIEQAAKYYLTEGVKLKTQFYQTAVKEFEKNGAKVYRLTSEENEAFMKHVYDIQNEIASTCTDKGRKLMGIIQEWRKANK